MLGLIGAVAAAVAVAVAEKLRAALAINDTALTEPALNQRPVLLAYLAKTVQPHPGGSVRSSSCLGARESRRQALHCLPLPAGLGGTSAAAQRALAPPAVPLLLTVFATVFGNDEHKAVAAVTRIAEMWRGSPAALLVEMIHFVPSLRVLNSVWALIERAAGLAFDRGVDIGSEWLRSTDRSVQPDCAQFKAQRYAPIDPRCAQYFEGRPATRIRLDPIRCGGVRREGIPPLKNPKRFAAKDATWRPADDPLFRVAYDHATQSMGSTLTGTPVVGAWVGRGIALQPL